METQKTQQMENWITDMATMNNTPIWVSTEFVPFTGKEGDREMGHNTNMKTK